MSKPGQVESIRAIAKEYKLSGEEKEKEEEKVGSRIRRRLSAN